MNDGGLPHSYLVSFPQTKKEKKKKEEEEQGKRETHRKEKGVPQFSFNSFVWLIKTTDLITFL
jgi:hypothetical protein